MKKAEVKKSRATVPLSLEDFMLGRAMAGFPCKFKTGLQHVKRFQMIQEAKEEFWDGVRYELRDLT
jgi:hypothetical protein